MPKVLTDAQVEDYRTDGYVCPIRAFDADAAAGYRDRMDQLEADHPGLWARAKVKPHLLMTWLNELMREPRILDAVEDVLGPDILAWATGHFDKKPHDPGFLAWHQDATYWGLSEPSVVTAWVALTPSDRRNGCLRVVPGTHTDGQLRHTDTFAADNMASRGQEITVDVDEAAAADLQLQPGEFSLHHTMLVHGSSPNTSDVRRCGITIRYVAAHVRQTTGFQDSATLVRGTDRHGHFRPEPRPSTDFDPAASAFYDEIVGEAERRKAAIAAQSGSPRSER
ncbi:phytanoyl-CoA dioxygenase [Streptomyces sp. SID8382]|uniref:Phytanoyl-CoA dioxygenase n=1 Tax=Streptomyces autolyticus TaxID=75293 RepID=A0ABN4VWG0_9ACTN|nr:MULTISPECIES: phytanoyl-CoA dioxygenase family protein [Streptomyces]AQA09439.1 phytanoyl-CoA dioxygenase [Streptomyces autolyticus]AUA16741.1 Phytanoyl-CoA dioxygenase (PhyH) [Streptomyces sp. M56]MCC4317399.1 phytanoyl-CoA dioxygenase family protein [Streptomyces malaysiensis]MYX62792.1 phytanoyl-CoA dioxygenase [Streptomyces sp. SID8382]